MTPTKQKKKIGTAITLNDLFCYLRPKILYISILIIRSSVNL